MTKTTLQGKKKNRFHRDMTVFNVVLALGGILANILVMVLVLSATQYSNFSKTIFLAINVVALILLLIIDVLIIIEIKTRNRSVMGVAAALVAIFVLLGGYGSWAILSVNSSVAQITQTGTVNESVSTAIVVYDENQNYISDLDSLNGGVVGLVASSNTGKLGQEKLDNEGLGVSYTEYTDYLTELLALFNHEIDAAILPSNYATSYSNEEGFEEYLVNTSVVLSFDSVVKSEAVSANYKDLTTEPFTVLLMGVADGLSDSIMLVSVNPISLKVTMTSIARDSYVPIACYAGGSSNKINSAYSAGGAECLMATVQNLTGVSIDYYVETNFDGVVEMVDALGGIVVNNPYEFVGQNSSSERGHLNVWVPAGDDVLLNGEQALAFARERHLYATGDFQRQANQQQVIKAIVRTVIRTRDVNVAVNVLNAAGNNVKTNFQVDQLIDFFNYVLKKTSRYYDSEHIENVFDMQGSRITGYSDGLWNESLGMSLYIYRLFTGSISDTRAAIQRNTDLTSNITAPKTQNFGVNYPFVPDSISQEAYAEEVITSSVPTTINNYVGSTIGKLNSWAKAVGVTVIPTYVSVGMEGYDPNLAEGTILSQSVAAGTNVSEFDSISVTVITHVGATPSTAPTGVFKVIFRDCLGNVISTQDVASGASAADPGGHTWDSTAWTNVTYEMTITATDGCATPSTTPTSCVEGQDVSGCSCTLGYTWTDNTCHSTAQTPNCTEGQDVSGCSCTLGYTWNNNTCHSSPEVVTPTATPTPNCGEGENTLSPGCLCTLGYTWTDNTCNSNPQTP